MYDPKAWKQDKERLFIELDCTAGGKLETKSRSEREIKPAVVWV